MQMGITMQSFENHPDHWRARFPWPSAGGNKYDRGHVLVVGGGWEHTGAARLAAQAALRVGAGLVSVACDRQSLPIYAASLTAVMTKHAETAEDVTKLLEDARINTVLIGPGAGVTARTKACMLGLLALRRRVVLDADALTVFADAPRVLFEAIHGDCLMTPHADEFARLFGPVGEDHAARLDGAVRAAQSSGAVVILKGGETVIAAPDGRAMVNRHATPFLATAGSGDVLAGICTGLAAQGMPLFDAACAAVWVHGEAARRFGAGLIAEDIADQLPPVLKALRSEA